MKGWQPLSIFSDFNKFGDSVIQTHKLAPKLKLTLNDSALPRLPALVV